MSGASDLAAALRELHNLARQWHTVGDKADLAARRSRSRRVERHFQTLNKAARAAATSSEALLWLMAVVDQDMSNRKAGIAVRQGVLGRMCAGAAEILDEPVFEATRAHLYTPQITAKGGKEA